MKEGKEYSFCPLKVSKKNESLRILEIKQNLKESYRRYLELQSLKTKIKPQYLVSSLSTLSFEFLQKGSLEKRIQKQTNANFTKRRKFDRNKSRKSLFVYNLKNVGETRSSRRFFVNSAIPIKGKSGLSQGYSFYSQEEGFITKLERLYQSGDTYFKKKFKKLLQRHRIFFKSSSPKYELTEKEVKLRKKNIKDRKWFGPCLSKIAFSKVGDQLSSRIKNSKKLLQKVKLLKHSIVLKALSKETDLKLIDDEILLASAEERGKRYLKSFQSNTEKVIWNKVDNPALLFILNRIHLPFITCLELCCLQVIKDLRNHKLEVKFYQDSSFTANFKRFLTQYCFELEENNNEYIVQYQLTITKEQQFQMLNFQGFVQIISHTLNNPRILNGFALDHIKRLGPFNILMPVNDVKQSVDFYVREVNRNDVGLHFFDKQNENSVDFQFNTEIMECNLKEQPLCNPINDKVMNLENTTKYLIGLVVIFSPYFNKISTSFGIKTKEIAQIRKHLLKSNLLSCLINEDNYEVDTNASIPFLVLLIITKFTQHANEYEGWCSYQRKQANSIFESDLNLCSNDILRKTLISEIKKKDKQQAKSFLRKRSPKDILIIKKLFKKPKKTKLIQKQNKKKLIVKNVEDKNESLAEFASKTVIPEECRFQLDICLEPAKKSEVTKLELTEDLERQLTDVCKWKFGYLNELEKEKKNNVFKYYSYFIKHGCLTRKLPTLKKKKPQQLENTSKVDSTSAAEKQVNIFEYSSVSSEDSYDVSLLKQVKFNTDKCQLSEFRLIFSHNDTLRKMKLLKNSMQAVTQFKNSGEKHLERQAGLNMEKEDLLATLLRKNLDEIEKENRETRMLRKACLSAFIPYFNRSLKPVLSTKPKTTSWKQNFNFLRTPVRKNQYCIKPVSELQSFYINYNI